MIPARGIAITKAAIIVHSDRGCDASAAAKAATLPANEPLRVAASYGKA